EGHYLAESHVVSFTPSATAYYLLSTPKPQAVRPIEVLGVGGASYSPLPLSSFDVLHFALHSAIDRDFPDRSGLVLTSHSSDTEDDLLQAREIIGLKLNADLVTLSACDGAAGTPEGIAGTDSLVQAFLMAGARSVVASVWQADD